MFFLSVKKFGRTRTKAIFNEDTEKTSFKFYLRPLDVEESFYFHNDSYFACIPRR
jgi:hypothetical protein